MITEKQRSKRLRRQRDLKVLYEQKLDNATSDTEKKHLEARIAEITSNMKQVSPLEPIALLPEITKNAEEQVSLSENREIREGNNKAQKMLGPKRERKKIKNAGSPF